MFRLLPESCCLKWFISVYNLSKTNKISNPLFDFIGYSNLFLAIAVCCSTFQGAFIFNGIAQSSFSFAILNFAASFFLYNLQRVYQSTLPTTDHRLHWYRRNKKWIFTLAILFVFGFWQVVWTIFLNYKEGIFVYCVCGILSLFYFLPPLSLRKIKFVKQFAIAFVWVSVCIVIPFMFHDNKFTGINNFTKDEWLYIVSQFCFIAALCIPFDIRDYLKDKEEGTKSFPVTIGIKNSKRVAIALMVIYFLLSFFIEARSLVVIRGFIFLVTLIVIMQSNEKRHPYYFVYLTDGIIILQTLLLYLL